MVREAGTKSTILVVDDHPIARLGIVGLLESQPDFEVCGEVGSTAEALNCLVSARPNLAIVDLRLGSDNGLDLVRRIVDQHVEISVLVHSMREDITVIRQALRCGAKGYVGKRESTDQLLVAVRGVLDGGMYLSEANSQLLIGDISGSVKSKFVDPAEQLSARELDVFALLGEGMATGDIANSLFVSVKTIESHIVRMRRKLDLPTGRDLLIYAIKYTGGYHGGPNE